MSGIILKTAQDVEDLTWGATFFGVGGGGTAAEGLKLLKRELKRKGPIACVDPDTLPDDMWTATVSFLGNRAPLSPEQEEQKKNLGLVEWKYENNMIEAVRFLEEITGKKIGALIVPELGGANTPSPIATAAALDIISVDADYCGRALPEIAQLGVCLAGHSTTPVACVDKWGNKIMIAETVNKGLTERIGKMLASAAFGNTAIALMLLPAFIMKKCVISGTMSKCCALGKAVREAKAEKKNVIEAVSKHTHGHEIFQGTLLHRDWAVQDGYLVGTHVFEGSGAYTGHVLKTWYKNENHLAWLDGEPLVQSPDIIAQIETNKEFPLLNNECEIGQHFAFIVLPALAMHRRPENLPFLTPSYYGFDIPYIPFEKE